jgi:alkanesulfonate monooxygenase SsuD/methylene tetrahydromethanopterin reductase-like flavin-dependent oxidoreductase (luciferase family)
MNDREHLELRIGIGLPAAIPELPDDVLVEWARRAESAGFSSLGVIDRLVYDNYDPLVALAAAAAVTERVQLVTTILNVLWRQSALGLAKQLWSLDRLASGRVAAGLGMGGWPEDFTETGTPQSGLGARFDAMVQEMQRAWSGEIVGAGGPLPALPKGRPTVLFGGMAPRSYERAARDGQGWVAPLFGFEVLLSGIAAARAAWSQAGRPGSPRILTGRYFCLGSDAEAAADEYVRHYYGDQFFAMARADTLTTEDHLVSEMRRLRDAGCHDVVLYPCSGELDQVERLAAALDSLGSWRTETAG